MKILRIKNFFVDIEKSCTVKEDLTYAYIEIIPNVAFRYVKAKFGKEINLYVSWLIWAFSITYNKKNNR